MLELLAEPSVDVRGLAHITGDGLNNLLRLSRSVGYRLDDPLPVPPVFDLIAERGGVAEAEMHEVFNMGCGFCVIVPESDLETTVGLLSGSYPEARRIGTVTDGAGIVERA